MPVNSFENYPMSWKPILPHSTKALYLTLAEALENDIRSGVLRPGTKLPPQRELADFLDINVSTVTRAFKLCANKGLLSSAVGSGTFVSYDVNTSTLILPETPADISLIELGSMMPETLPQREAAELLQKMLAETEQQQLFQYCYKEIHRYKAAAAELLKQVRLPVTNPDRLLFASGGQNAISAVFCSLFRPGDRIGVDPLIYPGVKGSAKLFGIQLVPIRQENGEMSEEGLTAAYKNEGIKGVYVMPDLHNPTNHTMSKKCREMLARKAKEYDLLILEDGINSLLLERPSVPIAALAPEHTVYMLSLSKTILPALRLAYLHVPAHCLQPLENALYHLNLSLSSLLLELATRLILSGRLAELFAARHNGILARNRVLDRVLEGYTVLGEEGCLSRWLLLPDGITGIAFEQMARAHGVSVYGSERFAVGKEAPVAAVRLAVCAPQSTEELEKGLMILKGLLDTLSERTATQAEKRVPYNF